MCCKACWKSEDERYIQKVREIKNTKLLHEQKTRQNQLLRMGGRRGTRDTMRKHIQTWDRYPSPLRDLELSGQTYPLSELIMLPGGEPHYLNDLAHTCWLDLHYTDLAHLLVANIGSRENYLDKLDRDIFVQCVNML